MRVQRYICEGKDENSSSGASHIRCKTHVDTTCSPICTLYLQPGLTRHIYIYIHMNLELVPPTHIPTIFHSELLLLLRGWLQLKASLVVFIWRSRVCEEVSKRAWHLNESWDVVEVVVLFLVNGPANLVVG